MSKKQLINNIWQFIFSKWVIYVTIFLVPLYFSTSHWFLFITPKTLLIIAGTLFASIFFVWGMIKNKGENIQVTSLHYILFSFLFIMSLAGFFGVDPHSSFFGTFFSSVGIVFLIFLGLLACLVSEFTRRDFNFISRLLATVFISGVIVALISYFPLFGFKSKVLELSSWGSTMGNSSFAGTFLLFAVGFGGYLTFTAEGWKKKLFNVLGILVILLCPIFFNADFWRGVVSLSDIFHSPLLASGDAQGAQLGVVVLAFSSIFLWFVVSSKKTTKIIGIILFIILMASLSIGYFKLLQPESAIHQRFTEMKKATRFLFWDISERAIVERPLLGFGFQNYQTVYQQHFDPIALKTGYVDEQAVTNPHNVIYDMAVSSGIPGLLIYLTLLGFTCFVFIKFAGNYGGKDRWIIILSGTLLGYFIQNLFVFDTPTAYFMYFICIGLAMGCLSIRKPEKEILIPVENMFKRKVIGYIFSVILFILFILFVVLPSIESRQWQNLRSFSLAGEVQKIEDVASISLMGGASDDARYTNEVLNKVDDWRKQSNNINNELQNKIILDNIISTVSLLEKDVNNSSGNFFANYEAGMLLHLAFIIDSKHDPILLDRARSFLDEARNISPLNPRVYYNIAQNELFRKNTEKAIGFIQTGMTLGLVDVGQAFLDRIKK